jgi:hypothetical protein
MTTTVVAIGDIPIHAASTVTGGGMTHGAVRGWLRLEAAAAFVAGIAVYGAAGGNLLLLPDASMVGYLAGPRFGAFAYNLAHNWAPGIAVLGLAAWLGSPILQMAAGILIAHVGMDRTLGYGLKLPTSFQDTHLGRIGRAKA